jgi:hypothetical protein
LHLPGGGGAAQRAGIFAIPLVIVVDARGEVIDSFNMIDEARLEASLARAAH